MRILMIAPEPFFEPRGTPFSEFHRIRALTALGHQVDLVTYPFGQDVSMPGLRVIRSLRPPFVKRVKIGPSAAKLPLDALLTLTAFRVGLTGKYDAIHSHEEGGVIGVVLSWLLRLPHLYDMHSSLPQQLTNFAFTGSNVHCTGPDTSGCASGSPGLTCTVSMPRQVPVRNAVGVLGAVGLEPVPPHAVSATTNGIGRAHPRALMTRLLQPSRLRT